MEGGAFVAEALLTSAQGSEVLWRKSERQLVAGQCSLPISQVRGMWHDPVAPPESIPDHTLPCLEPVANIVTGI